MHIGLHLSPTRFYVSQAAVGEGAYILSGPQDIVHAESSQSIHTASSRRFRIFVRFDSGELGLQSTARGAGKVLGYVGKGRQLALSITWGGCESLRVHMPLNFLGALPHSYSYIQVFP